ETALDGAAQAARRLEKPALRSARPFHLRRWPQPPRRVARGPDLAPAAPDEHFSVRGLPALPAGGPAVQRSAKASADADRAVPRRPERAVPQTVRELSREAVLPLVLPRARGTRRRVVRRSRTVRD